MKGLKYLKNGTVEFSKNLHLKTIGPKVLKKYHLKNVPFFEGLGPYLTGLVSNLCNGTGCYHY